MHFPPSPRKRPLILNFQQSLYNAKNMSAPDLELAAFAIWVTTELMPASCLSYGTTQLLGILGILTEWVTSDRGPCHPLSHIAAYHTKAHNFRWPPSPCGCLVPRPGPPCPVAPRSSPARCMPLGSARRQHYRPAGCRSAGPAQWKRVCAHAGPGVRG